MISSIQRHYFNVLDPPAYRKEVPPCFPILMMNCVPFSMIGPNLSAATKVEDKKEGS